MASSVNFRCSDIEENTTGHILIFFPYFSFPLYLIVTLHVTDMLRFSTFFYEKKTIGLELWKIHSWREKKGQEKPNFFVSEKKGFFFLI